MQQAKDFESVARRIGPQLCDSAYFSTKWFNRRCRFLDYGGLRLALRKYVDHFYTERMHQSLGNRPLAGKPRPQAAAQNNVTGFKASDIRCVTRCGGVIKHYYRVAA